MTIETRFSPGDEVKVKGFAEPIIGYVFGFYVDDAHAVFVNVRYRDTAGCVKVNYFIETQLSLISVPTL